MQLANRGGRVGKQPGVVAFAAMRMRRKVWAVSLDEQFVHRHAFHHRANPLSILEGDNAGKRDNPAAANEVCRHLCAAAVAMKHAAHLRALADHIKAVAVCFPVVNDHRETVHFGDAHLHLKVGALRLAVGVVVVIVKADFADGNNLVFLRLIQHITERATRRVNVAFRPGAAWMDADGGVHLRIACRLCDALL